MTRFARGGQKQTKLPTEGTTWMELRKEICGNKKPETVRKSQKSKIKQAHTIRDNTHKNDARSSASKVSVTETIENDDIAMEGVAGILEAQHASLKIERSPASSFNTCCNLKSLEKKSVKKDKNRNKDKFVKRNIDHVDVVRLSSTKAQKFPKQKSEMANNVSPRSSELIRHTAQDIKLMTFAGYKDTDTALNQNDIETVNDTKTKYRELLVKQDKREKRRLQRVQERQCKKVCFKCREPGHDLSSCPLIASDTDQGTGICFKCGSTEHSAYQCRIKLPAGEYPFAKCFICGERGHLSKQCPDNPRGLYPNGGCCKQCGSVEHLVRDCPEVLKKRGIGDVKLGKLDAKRSLDDDITDDHAPEIVVKKKKKAKVVKF